MSDVAQTLVVTLLAGAAFAFLARSYLPRRDSTGGSPAAGCPTCASGAPCDDPPAAPKSAISRRSTGLPPPRRRAR
jgi:hypothetical protein